MSNSRFEFDVFLSHSSKDKPTVAEVAKMLRSARLNVWFDSWQVGFGDNIPARIESGLDNSRVLILFMSANAFGSDWAQLESGTFRFRDPLNRNRRFLSCRLDDAEIPGSLGLFRYVDFRHRSLDRALDDVLQFFGGADPPSDPTKGSPNPVTVEPQPAPIEPNTLEHEAEYVRRAADRSSDLQRDRSFIDPWQDSNLPSLKSTVAAAQHAARLDPHGHVEPGIPSLRFSVQAKKLSLEEIRQKFGGAELNYDDYIAHVAASKTTPEVADVVDHICHMPAGWALQLFGAPGIGKSFILRQACIAASEMYVRSRLVPFYIELRDCPEQGFADPNEVLAFIAQSVVECSSLKHDQATDFTATVLREGRGLVLFDAIDEAGDPLSAVRPITEFMRHPDRRGNRYIFSCRTFDQVPGLKAEELVLLPLSYDSLLAYFRVALQASRLLPQVESQLRNAHFRRVLGTPLVASAYAKFVKDRNQLPKSLYEVLTDTLKQRFFLAAFQRRMVASSATDEQRDELYEPVAVAMRRLAHRMRNRMAPVTPPRGMPSITGSVGDVSALTWAQWAGVIYVSADNRVAFSLHRYKELYLAEKWTKDFGRTGMWSEEVQDRVGRIMWAESLILLGDLVENATAVLTLLLDFCEERQPNLSNISLAERYRFVEALILLARMSALRCSGEPNTSIYRRSLWIVHQTAFDERIAPPDRVRLTRSIGLHAHSSSVDILFAIYDDTVFVKDTFLATELQEAALSALAELIAGDVLGADRLEQFIRRAGRRALDKDVFSLLSGSSAAARISSAVEKAVRRTYALRAIQTVLVLWLLGMAWVAARSFGALGIASIAAVLLTTSMAVLAFQRPRPTRAREKGVVKGKTSSSAAQVTNSTPAGSLYVDGTGGGLPYSSDRYWIPDGEVQEVLVLARAPAVWTIATANLSLLVLGIALVVAAIQAIILLFLKVEAFVRFLRLLLTYAPPAVIVAGATGFALYQFRYRSQRRKWREQKEANDRKWAEMLERVKVEGDDLVGRDVDYIIDHLMDGIPSGPVGSGKIQARVEAIRRHMVSDPERVERLKRHLEGVREDEIKRMLWSAIDDITRLHVLKEEKARFAQDQETRIAESGQ